MTPSCRECLAELLNRSVAVQAALKLSDHDRARLEAARMDTQITRMILCHWDKCNEPETNTD